MNLPLSTALHCPIKILSPCLFNLFAEYFMRNPELEEAQTGIKIARINNNNHFIFKYNYCPKNAFYLWFVFIMKRGNASSHFNHGDRTGTLLREVRNCLRRRKALLNAMYIYSRSYSHQDSRKLAQKQKQIWTNGTR